MNPFKALSNDPILHIFSYLPRNDLLKLTLMDKNFNRIITESRETKAKIPLVLNFRQPIAIDDVIELAQKRQFKALKLKNICIPIEEEFTPLLELLSGTVEHLEISTPAIYEDLFRNLLQMFLPTLKTCDVGDIHVINSTATIIDEAISNHPLKSLRVWDAGMTKYFSGCKQLKSFEFKYNCFDNTDYVYEFLAQQTQLEKLIIGAYDVDLSRLVFIQLKELSLPSWLPRNVESEVAGYIEKLPNLTKLYIEIFGVRSSTRTRIMRAICNAPKLEVLEVLIRCSNPYFAFERLENHTVKTLRILHDTIETLDGDTGWLLDMFRGVGSVDMELRKEVVGPRSRKIKYQASLFDPSDMPLETIDKIEFHPVDKPFHITFSPYLVPVNIESFEAAVMRFAEKFSARIDSFTIGNSFWLYNGDFKLSNSFCEGVVKALPNLTKVELYNIADRRDFNSFLYRNRRTLKNLKEVKVHRNADEVRSKKMRIDSDTDSDDF